MKKFEKIKNLYLVPNLEKEILDKKEYKKPEAWVRKRDGQEEFLVLSPNYKNGKWEVWNTLTGEVYWTGDTGKRYAEKITERVKEKLEKSEGPISRLNLILHEVK